MTEQDHGDIWLRAGTRDNNWEPKIIYSKLPTETPSNVPTDSHKVLYSSGSNTDQWTVCTRAYEVEAVVTRPGDVDTFLDVKGTYRDIKQALIANRIIEEDDDLHLVSE